LSRRKFPNYSYLEELGYGARRREGGEDRNSRNNAIFFSKRGVAESYTPLID
jgi:hypothetical protein